MTRIKLTFVLIAVLAMVACNATPARKVFISVDTADTIRNETVNVYAGRIAVATQPAKDKIKAEYAKLVPYLDAVGAAELSVNEAMQRGDAANLNTFLAVLTDAVVALQNASTVKPAATQP